MNIRIHVKNTTTASMHLSNHSLRQIDDAYVRSLGPEALRGLSVRLLADLKEARERLNQGPANSSRPPSSRVPWTRGDTSALTDEAEESSPVAAEPAELTFRMPVLPVGDYAVDIAVASGTQQDHITHCWRNDALIFKSHTSSVHRGLVGVPMLDIVLHVEAGETLEPAQEQVS